MRIHHKTKQHRRDFYATYECEHCGHTTEPQPGYDDAHYHNNVIPNMVYPDVPAHIHI